MKKKLRGLGKRLHRLDLDLYREKVPIHDKPGQFLSVVDIFPEGAKESILFVHGFAGCAETWEYQINAFLKYRLLIPDLRGHGQSDAPDSDYTMEEIVADLDNVLRERNFPEKFILIGHSFGGSICVEFVSKYPERIEKLILLSTAGEYPLSKPAKMANKIPLWLIKPLWKYRPRWNAEPHVLKRMNVNNMQIWKGWDLLEKINVPTLIITGAEDRYFPRWVFEDVCKKIPNAEVINIGASKHKVQLERHRAVNRAIERFITAVSSKELKSWRDQDILEEGMPDFPWIRSYGDHTPPFIPIPRKPLFKFLETTAQWVPDKIATVFYDSTISYAELDKYTNQFAHALQNLGVGKGDRVMIVLPNMPQMIFCYYGILKLGAVVVLPNPDADAPTIISQLKQTQAKVLVVLSAFSELAHVVYEQVQVHMIFTNIQNYVSAEVYQQLILRWKLAGLIKTGEFQGKFGLNLEDLLKSSSVEPLEVKVLANDLACILFTSGTTDEPKGVRLSHFNLVANVFQTRHWIPKIKWGRETFLNVLPLSHSYGMTITMNLALAIGATLVLLSVFELKQVLYHIKKYKPTIFPGVPSIYMAINSIPNIRQFGLSSIKACISGAAPLPIEVQEAFEKLTHGRLVEGYGLTEASPVTHINPFKKSSKVGSIGIPISNTQAKIVDLITGEDLPPNKIGELVIKGPQIMQGYWKTNNNNNSGCKIKEGWLYTGDVSVMDSDGFFKIISRKRDTIMAGEFSVFPRDVEEVLYENSNVMEAAVVGIEAGPNKQKIKAFVVPRKGTTLTKEELLELCHRRLEEYAVPWEIEFREELPKSFVGKVLRRMLTE
ncbi:MAG: alpha/beta fold hydrolase [Candidatus Lokiarchaeota archaeon]|nr:alpha/beta fold hydrolase [Candidatus Harpocratesius repetitus]